MPILPSVLKTADRGHVLAALAQFAHKRPEQWCPPGHPAANGQLPDWSTLTGLPTARIIEAVAASAPNHCIDGWSYSSRALSALLCGDAHSARHLAYYAQLRAGLSILANLGVGIFNHTNFVVTSAGTISRLDTSSPRHKTGMGTHTAVWEALKSWGAGAQTSRRFLELVKIRGTPLRDCLLAIWPGTAGSGSALELIEAWGLDLKRSKDEHLYRNMSSYLPRAMNPLSSSAPDDLLFIKSFWDLFEPTSGSSFDKLDRFLLRSLLQKQHRLITGNSKYFSGQIVTRYHELPSNIRSLVSVDFLTGKKERNNPILLRASRNSSAPAQANEMIARAFLLLRAATSFTHSSFVEAGISCSAGDLRPWINPWAEARGFWHPSQPLNEPLDLWEDVELAMIDFEHSLTPPPTSMQEWSIKRFKSLSTIHEAERIGVWSLCA